MPLPPRALTMLQSVERRRHLQNARHRISHSSRVDSCAALVCECLEWCRDLDPCAPPSQPHPPRATPDAPSTPRPDHASVCAAALTPRRMRATEPDTPAASETVTLSQSPQACACMWCVSVCRGAECCVSLCSGADTHVLRHSPCMHVLGPSVQRRRGLRGAHHPRVTPLPPLPPLTPRGTYRVSRAACRLPCQSHRARGHLPRESRPVAHVPSACSHVLSVQRRCRDLRAQTRPHVRTWRGHLCHGV